MSGYRGGGWLLMQKHAEKDIISREIEGVRRKTREGCRRNSPGR